MIEAGASWIELRSWADSKFSRLPKELKMWKIPEAECDALLKELSQQDREKFWDCIAIYSRSARIDRNSCNIMQDLFNLAGIQNTRICRILYRKLTGASYETPGFDDWRSVIMQDAFNPLLRRARVSDAIDWLSAWKFRQLYKETTQGDI
jgi:hypothetical protein